MTKHDILDEQEFSDVCGNYRVAEPYDQAHVIKRFEEVKDFIRQNFVPKEDKRREIAAMAMEGLLSNAKLWKNFYQQDKDRDDMPKWISEQSKQYADALLSELDKPVTQ